MSSKKQNTSKGVWAGLIGVKEKLGSAFFEERIKGAYVNILAWASNSDEYRLAIDEALEYYGLYLFDAENIEPFSEWVKNNPQIDSKLLSLAEEVRETGNARFGTFHEFNTNDEKTK